MCVCVYFTALHFTSCFEADADTGDFYGRFCFENVNWINNLNTRGTAFTPQPWKTSLHSFVTSEIDNILAKQINSNKQIVRVYLMLNTYLLQILKDAE